MKNNFLETKFNLKNKTIIITGSCGQLGNSLCEYFVKSGCSVIGLDNYIGDDKLEKVDYFNLNVVKANDVENTFRKIYNKYKKIDVVINNAGVSTFEPFEERTEDKFDWVINVNLKGTFNIIQKYVKFIDNNKHDSGNIINIGSIYGLISPDPRIYGKNDRKIVKCMAPQNLW